MASAACNAEAKSSSCEGASEEKAAPESIAHLRVRPANDAPGYKSYASPDADTTDMLPALPAREGSKPSRSRLKRGCDSCQADLPTTPRGLAMDCGHVQGHGGANESLQRLLVYLLALVEVDGTPGVPVKTGVEQARRILQSRPFGEGHLHDVLVSLACADQSVVRPHRNPSPLPFLYDIGIGFLD